MKILVVAAHPDDEVLGCGGTIARHVREGCEVHVLILAEGLTSRDSRRDRGARGKELSALEKAARKANKILGVGSLVLKALPDNRLDSIDLLDIVKEIEAEVARIKPEIVYTHHAGDVNVDHRLIHQAVVTACRPAPEQSVGTILFFEVASSTEWQMPGSSSPFLPNWFVNISATLDLKLRALEAYSMEMRPWPHARSVRALEHLSRWRGASVGVEAAEAFILGRGLRR